MPNKEEIRLYREAKKKFPDDPAKQRQYVFGTMENQGTDGHEEHRHTCIHCKHPDHKGR